MGLPELSAEDCKKRHVCQVCFMKRISLFLPMHEAALSIIFIFAYVWLEKLHGSLLLVDDKIIICLQFALGGRFFKV